MKHRFGLKSRFLVTALAVYLSLGVISLIALTDVIGKLTQHLGLAYAGKYALASSALLREPLEREIALARLMADSPVIKEWVRDEANDAKREKAMAELASYQKRFSEKSWFLAIDASRHYYFDDEEHRYGDSKLAYTLTPGIPKDDWYFATLKNVPDFAINVNYDDVLDVHKVWINVVIHDEAGVPIGLTGTGLDLTSFLQATVDRAEPGVDNVFLDSRYAIQAHRDRAMIDQHSVAKPAEELSAIDRIITEPDDLASMKKAFAQLHAGNPSATFSAAINGNMKMVGVAYVSNLQWYALTMLDVHTVLGQHLFIPLLFMGALLALLMVLVVVLAVNRLVLNPLMHVTDAASAIAEGDYAQTLTSDRQDEIGELTRTFAQMSKRVYDYTQNLEALVQERTAQLYETNARLQEHADQLQKALANVKTLEGILPICAACKRVRDDQGYWQQVESYISQRTSAGFTHGICPDCMKRLYPSVTPRTSAPEKDNA